MAFGTLQQTSSHPSALAHVNARGSPRGADEWQASGPTIYDCHGRIALVRDGRTGRAAVGAKNLGISSVELVKS